ARGRLGPHRSHRAPARARDRRRAEGAPIGRADRRHRAHPLRVPQRHRGREARGQAPAPERGAPLGGPEPQGELPPHPRLGRRRRSPLAHAPPQHARALPGRLPRASPDRAPRRILRRIQADRPLRRAQRRAPLLARAALRPARERAPLRRAPPPSSFDELLARAKDLAGRRVADLAAQLGAGLPSSTTHGKGFVGALVEAALGTTAGSKSEPDFVELGVELKTIPLDPSGAPRESTFVCTVPLAEISELEFEESPLWKKLARVLFVPVEADGPLGERRFGASFLFEPTADERAALRR